MEKNLDKKQKRLLACELAEHVLHIYESAIPPELDWDRARPRNAVEASRKYARGETDIFDLNSAHVEAQYAIYTSIKESGRAAGRAAAHAAEQKGNLAAARKQAREAVGKAAWEETLASAKDLDLARRAKVAAEASEQKWQEKRLNHYLKGA